MTPLGRLFLEALRLDRWSPAEVRSRAEAALQLGVGGFVLFGGEAEEVARLTRELRGAAGRPLWVAADLERGAGQQFRGASELPPPAALAAHPSPEEAVRTAATATAREALALGVNWVLAPVLDLDVEPRNPIVGTRSFGADPGRVAILGRIWIEACQAEGVAACAKHFPGHGRSLGDSHLELPVVEAPREELEADLTPFRAVADVVASVMTAHVAYPSLGAPEGATLSAAALRDLLRGELGFRGVVVTDAMIMEGFRRAGPRTEGRLAARALAAGCDLFLYPGDLGAAIRGLAAALEEDAALREQAREAARRSEAACARYPAADAGGGPVGSERSLELAVGTLRPLGEPLPEAWTRERRTEVVVVSDDPAAEGAPGVARRPGEAFTAELRRRAWTIEGPREAGAGGAREVGAEGRRQARADGPREAGAGEGRAEQRILVVASTPRAWKGRSGLGGSAARAVARLADADVPTVLVVLGHPRLLEELGRPGLCAWSTEAVMERAAARWLDARR